MFSFHSLLTNKALEIADYLIIIHFKMRHMNDWYVENIFCSKVINVGLYSAYYSWQRKINKLRSNWNNEAAVATLFIIFRCLCYVFFDVVLFPYHNKEPDVLLYQYSIYAIVFIWINSSCKIFLQFVNKLLRIII